MQFLIQRILKSFSVALLYLNTTDLKTNFQFLIALKWQFTWSYVTASLLLW
jgi:hypothetical protein